MKRPTRIAKVVLASLLILVGTVSLAHAVPIDDESKYAWGENIGWLNWGTTEGDVDVPLDSGELTGYVWGENIGWISLNCSNTSSCATVDYGVSRLDGELSGYAWAENVGWISFSCENTGSCAIAEYRVMVNETSGVFSGYAWGENIGWISFNCENTASCDSVFYRVATVRPPSGGGGGGFPGPAPTPTPTPAPNITVSKMPSSAYVQAGDTITYSVTVRNQGTLDATGVVISDTIDADTTLVWVVPTPDTNDGTTFTFSIGTLSVGEEFSYTSQVQVKQVPPGTVIQNTVHVTGDNFTEVTATSAAIVVAPGGGAAPSPTPTTPPPSVTPTATPPGATPTPTPTGTVPPVPSPFPTPPSSPPPLTPPGPPSPTPPPGPIVRVIGEISQLLDRLGELFFGFLDDSCQGALGITSCGVTAVAAGALAAGLLAALLQHELAAAVYSFLQIIGIRKKARVWGVVYDSATKRPVPVAKLELVDANGRVLEVRYADREGRYGFLTTPASLNQTEMQVSIRASKPGYRFPSSRTTAGADYIVYERPYYGGVFNIVGDGIVNYSIPMDPLERGRIRMSGYGAGLFGGITQRLLSLGFIVGLVAVPLNYYLQPTTRNLIILVLFFTANGLRFVVTYRPYGVTVDAMTGKRLPYALVTLVDAQGTRIGFTVSDEHGRFVLSGQRNQEYDVVAYTPANVQPQRTTRQRVSKLSHVGRTAWVTSTIRI